MENAQWRGLGEGSEVPFDGGILGEGELEGRTITAARALTAEPGDGLEDQVAGHGSDSLVQALKEATPQALAKTLQTQPQDTCG
ncbi:hypothetical protein [Streptomyces sp. NPDC092903]|uniref:hypothetical protein n=1 Tax=Streptomyces sp. NPDC092903 TaxID=3366017 RepID=UPI00381B025F